MGFTIHEKKTPVPPNVEIGIQSFVMDVELYQLWSNFIKEIS